MIVIAISKRYVLVGFVDQIVLNRTKESTNFIVRNVITYGGLLVLLLVSFLLLFFQVVVAIHHGTPLLSQCEGRFKRFVVIR